MTSMKHVSGTLSISNPEKMDGRTHDVILKAAVNHGLGLIIKNVSREGVIEIDSISNAFGGREAAVLFIDNLTAILNEEDVTELSLAGSLMLTIFSEKEPMAFHITVTNGIVSYQEADLAWKEKVDNPYSKS